MASTDHMARVDQWAQIQPGFLNPWFTDLFSRDTDDLPETLHNSLTSRDPLSPFPSQPETDQAHSHTPTPTVSTSSFSGSTPERRHKSIPVSAAAPRGRVSKRKQRNSKLSRTTFIAADESNFRQMVQQVTGFRLANRHELVLKPQAQRGTSHLLPPGAAVSDVGCPATLGASSSRQNPGGAVGHGSMPLTPAADSVVSGFMSFNSLAGFPTLESWKVI